MPDRRALVLINGVYTQIGSGAATDVLQVNTGIKAFNSGSANQALSVSSAGTGTVSIVTPNATTAATAGGTITLDPGDGNTTGVGGGLTCYTGTGGAAVVGASPGAVGGTLTITTGSGGAGATDQLPGAGGAINLTAGNSGADGGMGGADGGTVTITAGDARGDGTYGGNVVIYGGKGGESGATASGGQVNIYGGDGGVGRSGGSIAISGGLKGTGGLSHGNVAINGPGGQGGVWLGNTTDSESFVRLGSYWEECYYYNAADTWSSRFPFTMALAGLTSYAPVDGSSNPVVVSLKAKEAASGAPGMVGLFGGDSTTTNTTAAGGVAIIGGWAIGTGNAKGGEINVQGGMAKGSSAGGDVNVTGGFGNTTNGTGNGGGATLQGGDGGANKGDGGGIEIRGGAAVGTVNGGTGGEVLITSGAGLDDVTPPGPKNSGLVHIETDLPGATGASGEIAILTGVGGATSGASGQINIITGATTSGASGQVQVYSGNATAGNSGQINIITGTTTTSGTTGTVTIGTGNSAAGSGGIDLKTGNAAAGSSGSVTIDVGTGTVSAGNIALGANNAINVTCTPVLYANGGIDRSTAAALNIGGTTATDVNLGRTGQTVKVLGSLDVATDLTVHGNLDVVGTSEFEDDVIFDNNVGIGGPDPVLAQEPNMLYFVARSTGSFSVVAPLSTGSISAAADLGGSIIAVANNGGNAEFQTGAVHNLSAGMYVTNSGCTDPNYNGTFLITSVPATDKYVVAVAYAATDTGTWKGLTRFTTGTRSPDPLSVGGWVEITGTTDYDGFKQVVAISDNTHFDINIDFTVTKTGTWNAGPIRVTSSAHTMVAGIVVTLNTGGYAYDGAWTISNVSDNTHFDIVTDWLGTQSGTWTAADSGGRFGGSGGSYPTEVLMPRDVNHTLRIAESPSGTPGGSLSIRAGDSATGGGDLNLDAGGDGINSGEIHIGGVHSSLVSIEINTTVGGGSTPYLTFGSSNITVQNGITLTTTGTGMIDLPQNFEINNVATVYATPGSGQVTAANLNTLTAGAASDASTLHTHSTIPGAVPTVAVTAAEAIGKGMAVGMAYDGVSAEKAYKATMTSVGGVPVVKANVVGLAPAAYGAGAATVAVAGEITADDASWVGGTRPAPNADEGKPVYVSTTAGLLTLTAPSASGDVVQKVGVVSFCAPAGGGGNNLTRIIIQIGDNVTL